MPKVVTRERVLLMTRNYTDSKDGNRVGVRPVRQDAANGNSTPDGRVTGACAPEFVDGVAVLPFFLTSPRLKW